MCKPLAAAGVLVGYEARNINADSVLIFYRGPRGAGSRFYGIFDGFEGLLRFLGVLGVL